MINDTDGPDNRIPEPLETAEIRMADGASITLRRHGNPTGPRIMFSHGNGLAADLYYPMWRLLMDRFDLVLWDLRNHGWNPVGERRRHNMPTFASDSRTIAEATDIHFGAKPRIGVFHSVAGIAALLHQIEDEDGYAGLVLLDPPICHLGKTVEELLEIGDAMAERTRQRRRLFDSWREYTNSVGHSPMSRLIPSETRDLLAQTTLRALPSGGYELCCPPEYEAQIYEYCFGWSMQVHHDLEGRDDFCPIKAIGSDPTVPYSFMPAMDLGTWVKLSYDFIPESTHFLPLEHPEECVALTVAFLEEHGLA